MTRTLLAVVYAALYAMAVLSVIASLYPVRGLFYGELPEHAAINIGQALSILALSGICYGLHVLIGKRLKAQR